MTPILKDLLAQKGVTQLDNDHRDRAALEYAFRQALQVDLGEFPNLDIHSLSPHLQSLIGRLYHKMCLQNSRRAALGHDTLREDTLYLSALEMFGVRCPHPVDKRVPYESGGYQCSVCSTAVLSSSALHLSPLQEAASRRPDADVRSERAH